MREVCEDLESWLWLKLAPYKFDINLSYSAFIKLQRIVSFEYGKLIIELKFLNNLGEMQYFFFHFLLRKKKLSTLRSTHSKGVPDMLRILVDGIPSFITGTHARDVGDFKGAPLLI